MKESTKELLGIKPADFLVYSAFILIVPVYFTTSLLVDWLCLASGFIISLLACYKGMKPHPELNRFMNGLKLFSYPAAALIFLFLGYLNFTQWS